MKKPLKIQFEFLKWLLLFSISETVILINIVNSDLIIFKLLLNYLFVAALVPIIIEKLKNGRIDIFSPFILFEFFYLLIFGLPALDLLVLKPELITQDNYYYNLAMICIALGLHFFQIGYFSKLGRLLIKKKPVNSYDWSIKKIKQLAIAFSLISLFAFLIVFQMSGGIAAYYLNIKNAIVKIATGSSLLFMAIILIKIPLLIWFCYNLKHKRFSISFYLFFIFVIFLLMSLGERGPFMFLFISLMVCYNYAKKRVNFFLMVTIGICLLMFLTIYIQYRELTGDKFKHQNISKHISYFNIKTYANFIINFDQLDRVKDMTKYVPKKLNFQYGKTFFNLIFKPIPSRIWSGKPQGAGTISTRALYPNVFAAKVTFAPSVVGELYLNFHILGVIVGLFFYGVLMKVLNVHKGLRKDDKNFMVFYAVIAPEIFGQIRGDFAIVNSWLLFHLFFLFFLLNYVKIKKKQMSIFAKLVFIWLERIVQ